MAEEAEKPYVLCPQPVGLFHLKKNIQTKKRQSFWAGGGKIFPPGWGRGRKRDSRRVR